MAVSGIGWAHFVASKSGGVFLTHLGYGHYVVSAALIPLFLTRAGNVWTSALHNAGNNGNYWSSTVSSASQARNLNFNSGWVNTANSNNRNDGKSVRCLVR